LLEALREGGDQAVADLLARERERAVVAPRAIDVQVPLPQPLVAEPQLLDDAQARRVLRTDVDLHPVQTELDEAEVRHQRDRPRDVATTGPALPDPVADRTATQRPERDRRDRDVPHQLAVDLDAEAVPRPPPGRAGLVAHVLRERRTAALGRGRGRLPPGQPVVVLATQPLPRGGVAAAQRPQ